MPRRPTPCDRRRARPSGRSGRPDARAGHRQVDRPHLHVQGAGREICRCRSAGANPDRSGVHREGQAARQGRRQIGGQRDGPLGPQSCPAGRVEKFDVQGSTTRESQSDASVEAIGAAPDVDVDIEGTDLLCRASRGRGQVQEEPAEVYGRKGSGGAGGARTPRLRSAAVDGASQVFPARPGSDMDTAKDHRGELDPSGDEGGEAGPDDHGLGAQERRAVWPRPRYRHRFEPGPQEQVEPGLPHLHRPEPGAERPQGPILQECSPGVAVAPGEGRRPRRRTRWRRRRRPPRVPCDGPGGPGSRVLRDCRDRRTPARAT